MLSEADSLAVNKASSVTKHDFFLTAGADVVVEIYVPCVFNYIHSSF